MKTNKLQQIKLAIRWAAPLVGKAIGGTIGCMIGFTLIMLAFKVWWYIIGERLWSL